MGIVELITTGDRLDTWSQAKLAVLLRPYQLNGPIKPSYPKLDTVMLGMRGNADISYAQFAATLLNRAATGRRDMLASTAQVCGNVEDETWPYSIGVKTLNRDTRLSC